MGAGLSFLSAAIIVVSSAIYYADMGMKTKENFFKGFPVVWNMVVFTLFVTQPSEWMSFAVVLACAVFTFAPVNFLHPVRVKRLRGINMTIFFAWCGFGLIALLQGLDSGPLVQAGIALSSFYLFFIGAVMQWRPDLGRKD